MDCCSRKSRASWPRGFSDLKSNEMFSGKSRIKSSTITHSGMVCVSVRSWVTCSMKFWKALSLPW
jgi:hypothetical protein